MAEPQQSAASAIDFSQPPPAVIDFTQPPPALEPIRMSDPRTIPNPRIRQNLPPNWDPAKDETSAIGALYHGAKTGATIASLPFALEATIPQLVGAVIGGTAGAAGSKKLAEAVGVGDFGQEIAGDLGNLAGGVMGAGAADAVAAGVSAVRQSRLGNALQNVLGVGKNDIIARIPVLGHLVRRPSFQDYIAAFKNGFKTPEIPETPELLQARALEHPGAAPIDPAAGLGKIPVAPAITPTPATPGAAGSMVESVAQPTPSGAGIPRTLNGESILGQVLGGRDQATLLKIARSRGIDVAQEAQLKPGVANKRIIGKIINDFTPEELDEVRAQGIENARFRHAFGDIGDEAWNTMALQTYFPDVKIPMSQLMRTAKAIQAAKAPKFAPTTDLAAQLKVTPNAIAPKVKPAAVEAGSLEDSLNQMLAGAKKGKKLKDLAAQ